MASAKANIIKADTGGPFAYIYTSTIGAVTASDGVANAGAALDAIKTLVAAESGTIKQITINVTLT